ncbi:MAG: polyphosphate polymerase domain-containing protein [Woeseiaceae bacterium]
MTVHRGEQLRHEVKFVTYATGYPHLRNWLHTHEAGFRVPYPARRVNNVYFDTWDYRAFAENLAGVSRRAKVRYRWYGEHEGPRPGQLEVKHRRNQLGWKQRYDVGMRVWAPGWGWDDVRGALAEQLPPDARFWLDRNPMAVFLSGYDREYFVSGDGRIRATLDLDQRVYDQRMRQRPNFRHASVLEDTVVLEFKFAPADRVLATDLLADIPVRLGRHSKYMNAVRAISFV